MNNLVATQFDPSCHTIEWQKNTYLFKFVQSSVMKLFVNLGNADQSSLKQIMWVENIANWEHELKCIAIHHHNPEQDVISIVEHCVKP